MVRPVAFTVSDLDPFPLGPVYRMLAVADFDPDESAEVAPLDLSVPADVLLVQVSFPVALVLPKEPPLVTPLPVTLPVAAMAAVNVKRTTIITRNEANRFIIFFASNNRICECRWFRHTT